MHAPRDTTARAKSPRTRAADSGPMLRFRAALGFTGSVACHRRARSPRHGGAKQRRTPSGTRLLLDALAGATIVVALHLFVVQVSVVRGHSMEPCLHDGDRLVVDRVAYNLGEAQRGDVAILRYPRDPAVDFVKRVVGLPGDRVAMHHGLLFVNGEVADDYGCITDHQEMDELVVPTDHFFVLGDNRPVSCDSRDFGLVAADLMKGRVRARFWPLEDLAIF